MPGTCDRFGDLSVTRNVTTACVVDGEASAKPEHKLQNRTKNGSCASNNSTTARLTRWTFDQLQKSVDDLVNAGDFTFGSNNSLPDATQRARLIDIRTTSDGNMVGEGTKVVFVAYILEGHFAGAESVNCDLSGQAAKDIHLILVTQNPKTANLHDSALECSSVTAEVSPHFRPVEWEFLGKLTGKPAAEKFVKAQHRLADDDLQRPMRFTGQLMFDALHKPCGPAGGGHPDRRSSWEIHPVFAIDVCDKASLTSCKFDDGPRWKPLHTFLAEQQ